MYKYVFMPSFIPLSLVPFLFLLILLSYLCPILCLIIFINLLTYNISSTCFGKFLPIFRSVRLRFLQHMVSCGFQVAGLVWS